jgi:diguanylate cyclase (GGDEF)-like protein/PAS domain S-box-containing protein
MAEADPRHAAARWLGYRAAIEHAGDGFFVIDNDFRFVEVNDTLCAMFGYSSDEMLGRSPLEFATPQSRVELLRQWQSLGTAQRRRYRIEGLRKDGTLIPVLVRSVTHIAADGEIAGSVGFVTDLSEIEQAQQTLAASERELRSILDNMQDTYYRTDTDGRIVRASKSAERLLGYPLEELIGRRLADLYVDPSERDRFLSVLAANGGSVQHFEARLRRRDGTVIWVSTNAQYYRDAAGRVAGVEGTTRDITDARRAQDELRLAARVFECAAEGIVITDRALAILSVNPAFAEMVGVEPAPASGRRLAEFVAEGTGADFEARLREALTLYGQWSGEVRARRVDGSAFPSWLSVSTVRDAAGAPTHCVATFSDITERQASQARMAFLAHHDPLTQLPNRLLLRDRVDQAISRSARSGTKLALLFVDLDHFKQVNDSFGHQTGDALLREIAGRLAHCVRETDTVSRHGGDEFVIALPDLTDVSVVERVARCVAEQVAAPLHAGGVEVRVSCSIGAAIYPGDGEDYDALVRRADASMYAAKRAARAFAWRSA